MKNHTTLIFNLLLSAVFIASCSSDENSDENEQNNPTFTYGTVTDIDGNSYNTITIGTQTWMAENLKVTKYPDGTDITYISDDEEWANLDENNTDAGYCFYNNNYSGEKDIYGALYTFSAAVNGEPNDGTLTIQGICPDGWHIPSNDDWDELLTYAGGKSNAGLVLKDPDIAYWESVLDEESDEYGFSALPGGYRYLYDGTYIGEGGGAFWWSSQENTTKDAYGYVIYSASSKVSSSRFGKSYGFSVRCVMD